jgi:hypothetical protein
MQKREDLQQSSSCRCGVVKTGCGIQPHSLCVGLRINEPRKGASGVYLIRPSDRYHGAFTTLNLGGSSAATHNPLIKEESLEVEGVTFRENMSKSCEFNSSKHTKANAAGFNPSCPLNLSL